MNLFDVVWLAAFALLVALCVLLPKYLALRSRFRPILDVEAEVSRLRQQVAELLSQRDKTTAEEVTRRQRLNGEYNEARATYERLKREVSLLEENLEDMSFGVYKPHYTFDSSEEYKKKLEEVWEKKKALVRAGQAAVCATTWTVSGSTREGARMVKQATKVMLRAFNGEADAAVAKVTWNNVTRMEERIRGAYSAINSLGAVQQIQVTPQYLDLALAELRLTYEEERKKREEQEEQRQIRERMREEERAQREYERAQQEAATEQQRYEKALAQARAEVEQATGAEIESARQKVQELEQKLSEAQAKMQRALSMAQQTKSGHVYIISNIGSFGDTVFKIGLTRRLEPLDRVHELGDAAVPFQFDVHAMIYSEDSPALEAAFHKRFHDRRVNLVNMRKEYFTATLPEIEEFVRSQGVTVEFTKLAEAREFRETCAIRERIAAASARVDSQDKPFPDSLPAAELLPPLEPGPAA
jgi:predicted nuclease with TOPRIM domain